MKNNENARHMENLRVITKLVRIEDSEFVLISFDAQTENMKEFYGERVFGLIDYKHLDENGCLNKPLMNGEMAISSTPAEAIERSGKTFCADGGELNIRTLLSRSSSSIC